MFSRRDRVLIWWETPRITVLPPTTGENRSIAWPGRFRKSHAVFDIATYSLIYKQLNGILPSNYFTLTTSSGEGVGAEAKAAVLNRILLYLFVRHRGTVAEPSVAVGRGSRAVIAYRRSVRRASFSECRILAGTAIYLYNKPNIAISKTPSVVILRNGQWHLSNGRFYGMRWMSSTSVSSSGPARRRHRCPSLQVEQRVLDRGGGYSATTVPGFGPNVVTRRVTNVTDGDGTLLTRGES